MKKGYIQINDYIYKSQWENVLFPIFKEFKPFNIIKPNGVSDYWIFEGECDLFDEINDGEKLPQYEVRISIKGNETSHSFIKLN